MTSPKPESRAGARRRGLGAVSCLWTWAVLSLLMLVTGIACGDIGLDGQTREPEVVCSADSDCGTGLVCQANRCVDASANALPVSLQLRFPTMPGDLRQQVTGLLFEPELSMPTIEPNPVVDINLQIVRNINPVPATVRFRAQRGIPGTQLNVSVQTAESGATTSLLPGVYDVTVRPAESSRLPPRTYRGVSIEAPAPGESLSLQIPLVRAEEEERLVVVRGKLLLVADGVGTESVADHVRVSAVSADGALTTQSYTTCEDDSLVCDGSFELVLPAQRADETRQWQLVVEPTEDSIALPKMTLAPFEIGPTQFVEPVESTVDSITVELGTQRVDSIPSFRQFYGIIEGKDGKKVSGVFISAKGVFAETGIEYTTTAPAPTGIDGAFVLDVPDVAEATITLTASVDSQSPYASGRFEDMALTNSTSVLTLDRKPLVVGQVRGRSGAETVANATISARPTGSPTSTTAMLASQATTSSSDDGSFSLQLEPGTYEIAVIPPTSSGLPRSVQMLSIGPADNVNQDFVLGRSSVVYGAVRNLDGLPAPGVSVDVFHHVVGSDEATLLGTGTTDEDGVYRVIVPNPDDF